MPSIGVLLIANLVHLVASNPMCFIDQENIIFCELPSFCCNDVVCCGLSPRTVFGLAFGAFACIGLIVLFVFLGIKIFCKRCNVKDPV